MKQKELVIEKIQDAIENLSTIAEMDIKEGLVSLGIVAKRKVVFEGEGFPYKSIDWIGEENAKEAEEKVEEDLGVVLAYLKEIYEDSSTLWDDPDTRKGLQSMMLVVGEAVNKIDLYFKKKQFDVASVGESDTYKKLQNFYIDKIEHKIKEGLEGEGAWSREWERNEKGLLLDLEKSGTKDFETIKRDQDYELFYLRDDDEKMLFTNSLKRNLKLFCNFEEMQSMKGEDPLLDIRKFVDQDLHLGARQILKETDRFLKLFYSGRFCERQSEFTFCLNKALFSLMLASNPKNLIQNTKGKSCFCYFDDFQFFLKEAMRSDDYQKMKASLSKSEEDLFLLKFVHSLCRYFFLRLFGIREEVIGFIYAIIKKSCKKREFSSFLEKLIYEEEKIREFLSSFPSGPLLKMLDVLRDVPEEFTPILQNRPYKLYCVEIVKGKRVDVLKIPSPTRQHFVSKAFVVEEFLGFLRSMEKENLLMVNLQDRTSWREYARCHAIEEVQKRAEFESSFSTITLSEDSDFYFQTGVYEGLTQAKDFLKTFHEQLLEEGFGFYFPKKILTKDFIQFIKEALKFVHEWFFDKKEILSKREREDFIEIVYLLIVLKSLEESNSSFVSFTCKDAVDKGATKNGAFFAFVKLMNNQELNKGDEEFLTYLFYSTALLVRERMVDSSRLNRAISALAVIDAHKNKNLTKAFYNLYRAKAFKISTDF